MEIIKHCLSTTIILLPLFGIMVCNTDGNHTKKIKKAIENELHHYPNATLIDIYKNFFQDAFGPGHMIPDTHAAVKYLNYELKNAQQFNNILWQPLGANNNYYRINLLLIKDSIIPKEKLLHAFIASANKANPPTVEEWEKQWQEILKCIRDMPVTLENYKNDKKFIDSLLSKKQYVVHHSEIYVKHYHPHYRIVHRDELKKLIKYLPSENRINNYP